MLNDVVMVSMEKVLQGCRLKFWPLASDTSAWKVRSLGLVGESRLVRSMLPI